jgi:hypothetical protein
VLALRQYKLVGGLLFQLRETLVILFDIDMVGFGEQAAWNGEPLHLVPLFVSLLGTLQRHDVGVLRSRIVQPFQGVADILSVAVACALLATELFKGYQMNVSAAISLSIVPLPRSICIP